MKDYRLLQLLARIKNLIKNFVIDHGLKGIDRVVENGRAAEYSFNWDGYD